MLWDTVSYNYRQERVLAQTNGAPRQIHILDTLTEQLNLFRALQLADSALLSIETELEVSRGRHMVQEDHRSDSVCRNHRP